MKDLDYYLSKAVPKNGCLIWTGAFNSDGYPREYLSGNLNGKAHREVFFLVHGYYPPVVRHSCDNIKCIEPSHLFGGSSSDNMRDRVQRGRTFGHVTKAEVEEIFTLKQSGKTHKQVADILNIKWKRVGYIVQKWSKGQEQFVE